MDVFEYMPLDLWKDMAERFLDPTSFGRLRQVNKALRDRLDERSKEKMVERCTITTTDGSDLIQVFMNRKYVKTWTGTEIWRLNDKYHRDADLPALIDSDGSQRWYQHGRLHRDHDLPALIDSDGSQGWYQHGNLHRENGRAAVINADGTQFWYKNGQSCH